MKCDRKVGLREITAAKNNRPKAAMGERRSADPTEKWGYIAVFPHACSCGAPRLWQGAPVSRERRGMEGAATFGAVAQTSNAVSELGHVPRGRSPPRGRWHPARTGLMPAQLPAHPGRACLRAHRLDYISLFPSRLEHRKPLCRSFTQGLHWYLINSIKQAP